MNLNIHLLGRCKGYPNCHTGKPICNEVKGWRLGKKKFERCWCRRGRCTNCKWHQKFRRAEDYYNEVKRRNRKRPSTLFYKTALTVIRKKHNNEATPKVTWGGGAAGCHFMDWGYQETHFVYITTKGKSKRQILPYGTLIVPRTFH